MKISNIHWTAGLALATFVAVVCFAKLGAAAVSAQTTPQAKQDEPANQLTDAEKKAGWRLLFDGKTLDGWSNFKKESVRPGWVVKDGLLVCATPNNAGDIVTKDQYDWFELVLDFNISVGGNSGIIFHVTNVGKTTWATGPEIQLLDNVKGTDAQRCGWLYQLYKPDIDPKTNKPFDATKPAGQWNQIRVVLAAPPGISSVTMNGMKYYDFVYNSEDWKARVATSKFKKEKDFAKSDTGYICLQGDHGSISFRNVKLRPLPGSKSPGAGKLPG